MSYFDDGRPWAKWEGDMKALAGGEQSMAKTSPVDATQLPTLATHRIGGIPGATEVFNPSVAVLGDQLKMIVRTIRNKRTVNYLGTFERGAFINGAAVNDVPNFKTEWGIEDCRLFVFNKTLWAVAAFGAAGAPGTPRVGLPKSIQAFVRIDNGHFTAIYPQQSPRHEKNWMPVVDEDQGLQRLRLVYSTDPSVALQATSAMEVGGIPTTHPQGTIRGGSQLISYSDDEYLAVVHEVSSGGPVEAKGHIYSHRFVTFDKVTLAKKKMGRPFYFQTKGIEFVAGLAIPPWGSLDSGERTFCLSYGINDKTAYMAEVAEATVEEFLT